MSLPTLQNAIIQFDNWEQPWTFHDAVTSKLQPIDAEEFEIIWQTALDDNLWNVKENSDCSRNAHEKVSRLFPKLDHRAITAIVNAAAYQWK